jgi:glycine C-acetyltransferase
MAESPGAAIGENFNLQEILLKGKKLSLDDRLFYFSKFIRDNEKKSQNQYCRQILSKADREVTIFDRQTGKPRKMLMFGSNNYLGLASHPYVCEAVRKAIRKYGVGIGGPPLLNGYTTLMHSLEERLSAFKHAEDTIIFPCGFSANMGLISGLLTENDAICYDECSHASIFDGVKMSKTKGFVFRHNSMDRLRFLLGESAGQCGGQVFVSVEGVYSMDGDLAPLDRIVELCQEHRAILIVDDAHGTGIMGKSGKGTSEHFGVSGKIDINMGTFSKVFAVTGGFISSSRPVIQYLRFFARPYMFSASIPPVILAAVHAGLDVIEKEPERRIELFRNVQYVTDRLRETGLVTEPGAAIIALRVPLNMNIRVAANEFHQEGIFINSIEYPAVPVREQRFRISIMATHTREDLDRLIGCVERVWSHYQ